MSIILPGPPMSEELARLLFPAQPEARVPPIPET